MSYLACFTVMVSLFFLILVLNMPGMANTSACNYGYMRHPQRTKTTMHEYVYARPRLHLPTSARDQDCARLRLLATKIVRDCVYLQQRLCTSTSTHDHCCARLLMRTTTSTYDYYYTRVPHAIMFARDNLSARQRVNVVEN